MNRLIILLTVISLCLCGCAHQMPLQQPVDNIAKIRLVNEENEGIQCTLTEEDTPQFMHDLLALECRKNLEPQEEVGYLQIRIIYENGDMDIIGCCGNAWTGNGEYIMDGWYKFSEDDFLELFRDYWGNTL